MVRLLMILSFRKKQVIRLGRTIITTAASCIVQLVEYCPLNLVRLTEDHMLPGRRSGGQALLAARTPVS
jgi:hypothetical protein